MNEFEKIAKVYNRLKDQESKDIFDLHIKMNLKPDMRWKMPMSFLHGDISLSFFDEWYQDKKRKDIVVYGGGTVGAYTVELLMAANKEVRYVCETNPQADYLILSNGVKIPIIDLDSLTKLNNVIVVIGSILYTQDIYELCLYRGIRQDSIFYPPRRFLLGYDKNQYFDFFKPNQNEIFVDVGAYDGSSSLGFVDWCNGLYDGIYIFEPNRKNINFIKNLLENNGVTNHKIIAKGAWDKDAELSFVVDDYNAGASKIDERAKGIATVPVTSIDNALSGKRITFIKMDIEGSEYQALWGAKDTIKHWHPRLAISVYHKQDDFYEIPNLLLSIDDTYNIAFRVYTSDVEDVIMYAW